MVSLQQKTALIGPGAIGTTIAAALFEKGHHLQIFGRTAHPHLELRHDDGSIIVPGPVKTDPSEAEGPFDIIFVAVKQTQTEAIAPWLKKMCGPETVVCVLQNGVEQKEQFSPLTGQATVLPSVVWFPAQRESDTLVWLRDNARLTLPDTPQARQVQALLQDTRCAVDLSADFISVAWRKLLQNAVAGLMVLSLRRAGMFRRDDIIALAERYIEEGLNVARAEGATLADTVVQDIINRFRLAPTDLGTSILADRQAGHPLEWDCRNGVIQRRGKQHGIPTPVSDVVVPLLAAASEGPG